MMMLYVIIMIMMMSRVHRSSFSRSRAGVRQGTLPPNHTCIIFLCTLNIYPLSCVQPVFFSLQSLVSTECSFLYRNNKYQDINCSGNNTTVTDFLYSLFRLFFSKKLPLFHHPHNPLAQCMLFQYKPHLDAVGSKLKACRPSYNHMLTT